MKQKRLACGAEKDTDIKEVYPFSEDGITNKPIGPLLTVDCKGSIDWRIATVCHACFHKLNVDMWIGGLDWQALNPVTPFEKLPKLHRQFY
jgi:hypothetical protein